MTTKYKYIASIPITGEPCERVINYMDQIATYTKVPPPHIKMAPHVTLHRPIAGISKTDLAKLVDGLSQLVFKKARIRYSGMDCFGTNFIVLPIHASRTVAEIWTDMNEQLRRFAEYEHGPFDHDNTLHVSLAGGIHQVFARSWPSIEKMKMSIEPRDINVEYLELHRKPLEGGSWEQIERFTL